MLCCQQKAGRCTRASVVVSFDGKPAFDFDAMKKKWAVIDPAARAIQEDWEHSKELAEHFRKVLVGDCNHWLSEFLKYMEPTGN